VFTQLERQFDNSCERWRTLYRGALAQQQNANKIILDHTRSQSERNLATSMRKEAEAQLGILTEKGRFVSQSDFYSYRYFASEGFLPGYSFPRLPLSAFLPGFRRQKGVDEFLSRSRFMAISEFGPRAIVYHEGSRYIINRVLMPFTGEGDELQVSETKYCCDCGYIHPMHEGIGADLCQRCGSQSLTKFSSQFRLRNVATKRRDRINCDEEERRRYGFEIRTGIRFPDYGGVAGQRVAVVKAGGEPLLVLTYCSNSTITKMNLGERRRENQQQYGFLLDRERGYWAKNKDEDDNDADQMGRNLIRVVPFVEDRKNALLVEPVKAMTPEECASLQAALKNAIQLCFQLEDGELSSEPLPDENNRRLILFYEAAEGGAGVLKRLVDDREALGHVARQALYNCHFHPQDGEWRDMRKAYNATEECRAACYSCLMSYSNQRDHEILDRHAIKDILVKMVEATVEVSSTAKSRADQFDDLLKLCDSELEKRWLRFIHDNGYRLPTHAQRLIEACSTKPDFIYAPSNTVVYVDGPPHDYPERQTRDKEQEEALDNNGFTVVRFHHQDDWVAKVNEHPNIFGKDE